MNRWKTHIDGLFHKDPPLGWCGFFRIGSIFAERWFGDTLSKIDHGDRVRITIEVFTPDHK